MQEVSTKNESFEEIKTDSVNLSSGGGGNNSTNDTSKGTAGEGDIHQFRINNQPVSSQAAISEAIA